MTKSELEKKPLSDLHSLAAEAGVERFRMLTKAELVEKLADGDGGGSDEGSGGGGRAPRSGRSRSSSGSGSGRDRSTSGSGRTGTNAGEGRSSRSGGGRSEGSGQGRSEGSGEGRSSRSGGGRSEGSGGDGERPRRRRRRSGSGSGSGGSGGREREAAHEETEEEGTERVPETPPRERAPEAAPAASSAAADSGDESSARPKRRRRRRRFGRRKDGVSIQDLLLPPESGRQAVLVGETRAACTALLRGIAADLAGDSKGPDPVALLIDPTPEELADWKREAPKAEIVSAGQARHATDALALAKTRAASEDVILLVDSLTRLAEDFGDVDTAKDFFDAGQDVAGSGSLTVVVALERPAE